MIELVINDEYSMIHGELIYRTDEYSFDFVPAPGDALDSYFVLGMASLLVGTLQLEIDVESGRVLFPSGYYPLIRYKLCAIVPPVTEQVGLRAISDHLFSTGVGEKISDTGEWPTLFDNQTGWVGIGQIECGAGCRMVEFATNSVALLSGERLVGLLLRPRIVDERQQRKRS